ncbi:MAG: hypothetical protein KF814_00270 [Nitrospiraceae bacterium]|nr:hypothetical protein [Nitrospiraceae bacterium]
MRPFSAGELLEVWEQGSGQPLARRALALLSMACPDLDREALARLSIGQRDGLLLSVRESAFGATLSGITNCPKCGEQLETYCYVEDLRTSTGSAADEPGALSANGYEVRFRLPDSNDLLAAGDQQDAEAARKILLERCVLSARRNSAQLPIGALPEEIVAEIEREMLEMDSQADVHLEFDCPACSAKWSAVFDILAFLWGELDAWAQRLLLEVHSLASAYGWREADILEMSATRRSIYLNMVSG